LYRIYYEAGNIICQKKIGGTKTTLATIAFNSTNHKFLSIRHDSSAGNVVFETAPDSGSGVPGAWTRQYSEAWNTTSIPLASMLFELKAGTWQSEANAPGTVIFDNFMAAVPGSGGGLDATKWNNTVFSGTQNTSVPLADANGQLQIGALFQNT